MAKKKFAMMIMNPGYDPERDRLRLDTPDTETHIITVQNAGQALETAARLADQGFGAIEVCGAFGEKLAQEMYEAAGCRVPVGYVTTPPGQLPQALAFWGEKEQP